MIVCMEERAMRAVLELAAGALERGELPVAAAVVHDGEVIASAATAEKAERRFLVHAELRALLAADALRPFPGRRRDCTLVTNVEPCLMCMGAALSFFAGGIQYGLESPTDGAVGLARGWVAQGGHLPGSTFPKIEGGVLRAESRLLFQDYVARTPERQPTWGWAKSLADLPP